MNDWSHTIKLGLTCIVGGIAVWMIHLAIVWWPDYGRCLLSHQEPRHRNAWVEMRPYSCGRDCTSQMPIYHPEEDWIDTVCDAREFPDGDGPSSGSARKQSYR